MIFINCSRRRKRRKTTQPHSHPRTTAPPPHTAEGGTRRGPREPNPKTGRNTQAREQRARGKPSQNTTTTETTKQNNKES